MVMSVNGYIADEKGSEEFLSHDNWLEFVKRATSAGGFVWGRKTYEAILTWGSSYLEPLKNLTSIVLTTQKNFSVQNGFHVAHSPKDAISIAQERKLSELIITGGAANNTAFLKTTLFDQIILNIEPVLLGSGIPIFKPDDFLLNLELVHFKTLTPSILQCIYKPINVIA